MALHGTPRPTLRVKQEARVPVSNMLGKVDFCIDKLSFGVLELGMEHRNRIGTLERQADVLRALGEVLCAPFKVAFAESTEVRFAVPRSKTKHVPSTLPMQWLRSIEVKWLRLSMGS